MVNSDLPDTSTVSAAKPGARIFIRNGPESAVWKVAIPSAEVVCVARILAFPARKSESWAPATTADCGSSTLKLRSAADAATARSRVGSKPANTRISSSFARERGSDRRIAPVSWLASKDVGHPDVAVGLPGISQWPRAISSLTVARQRGICTRFPVFAERQRRAFRKTFQRAGRNSGMNLTGVVRGSQPENLFVVTGRKSSFAQWTV